MGQTHRFAPTMLQPNFHPFPVLQTPRLVLRRITLQDAEALYEMRRDKEMMQHIARPLASCIEDVHRLIEVMETGTVGNNTISWAITLQTEDKLIGTIGFVRMKKEDFRGEIGYMLAGVHQGKGLMSEAVQAVVQYGFTITGFHSIEAVIAPQNTASARVLQKAGFVQEALFRENLFFEGKFLDSAVYSLLAPQT
jgi:[ribosomal protein S5]-alanine N-acetyltransferase